MLTLLVVIHVPCCRVRVCVYVVRLLSASRVGEIVGFIGIS